MKTHRIIGAGYEVLGDDGEYFYKSKNLDTLYPEIDIYNMTSDGEVGYNMLVPCQQCIGCRIDYARRWADRIVMEQLVSPPDTCFFITLTYNDEAIQNNLTGNVVEIVANGESFALQSATLIKDDVRLFIKRLRKYYADHYNHQGIRFYLAGEYGSKYKRPHYHLCVFNLPIYDLKYYSSNFRGDVLYTSEIIESIWNKGYVVIGELTWECAAYTARYVVKKFKGKDSAVHYEALGRVLPEFTLSSNRPGIGGKYFDDNVEKIYRTDSISLPSTKDRNGTVSVPRYFDKLLERYIEENPDTELNLDKIKAKRRKMQDNNTFNRRILSGLFDEEYFSLKEENFKKNITNLRRMVD